MTSARSSSPASRRALATPLRRLLATLPVALFAAAQPLLVGPYTIFITNRGEQLHGFSALAGEWWPLLLLAIVLPVAAAALLPPRAAAGWLALLFALGLLLWLQGGLLLADYGQLDGSELDFARHAGRAPFELALWLALPLAALVFRRRTAAVAPFASAVLLVLQLAALPFLEPPAEAARATEAARIVAPPPELFAFAPDGNVLILILDAYQSDVFAELAAAEGEAFDRDFDGFVFYADHLGAFPTTRFSVPALLSGAPYRNDVPAEAYLDEALGERSLLTVLGARGFEVDMASINRPMLRGPADHRWAVPRPYVAPRDHRRFAAAQLLDLGFFRHAPHVVKPWIYNRQAWRLQARYDVAGGAHQAIASVALLEDLARRMRVDRRGPLVKLLHVGGAHLPVVLDADCRPTGEIEGVGARAGYRAQARCALRPVAAVLERLRRLGIYDSSLIVITSDHGVYLRPRELVGETGELGELTPIIGQATPLLLLKPPDGRGPLRTSRAPSAITDLPATVAAILGLEHEFPGRPILELEPGTARPRIFGHYRWLPRVGDWRDHFLHALHLYRVMGPVHDVRSWSYRRSVLSPLTDFGGAVVDLAREEARGRLGPGWHRAPGSYRGRPGWWAVADEAVIFAALGPGEHELRARLVPRGMLEVQAMVDGAAAGGEIAIADAGAAAAVVVDDATAGVGEDGAAAAGAVVSGVARLGPDDDELVLILPASPERPAVSTIRLRLRSVGDRPKGALPGARAFFESISFVSR